MRDISASAPKRSYHQEPSGEHGKRTLLRSAHTSGWRQQLAGERVCRLPTGKAPPSKRNFFADAEHAVLTDFLTCYGLANISKKEVIVTCNVTYGFGGRSKKYNALIWLVGAQGLEPWTR